MLDGLIQPAVVCLKHAEKMQRIRITLVDRKDLSIKLFRLPTVTDTVSRRGTTKQIVGALRHA
jgi:phosphotransferase system IIB component